MESIVTLIGTNLEFIVLTLAAIIGGFVWKNRADKKDAIASLKSGIAAFFQQTPGIKAALVDGKVTSEEWGTMLSEVGPTATNVATRGGAKILKRWIESDNGKGTVAKKYIEGAARGLAIEFGGWQEIERSPDMLTEESVSDVG